MSCSSRAASAARTASPRRSPACDGQDWITVHDAARPLTPPEVFRAVLEAARDGWSGDRRGTLRGHCEAGAERPGRGHPRPLLDHRGADAAVVQRRPAAPRTPATRRPTGISAGDDAALVEAIGCAGHGGPGRRRATSRLRFHRTSSCSAHCSRRSDDPEDRSWHRRAPVHPGAAADARRRPGSVRPRPARSLGRRRRGARARRRDPRRIRARRHGQALSLRRPALEGHLGLRVPEDRRREAPRGRLDDQPAPTSSRSPRSRGSPRISGRCPTRCRWRWVSSPGRSPSAPRPPTAWGSPVGAKGSPPRRRCCWNGGDPPAARHDESGAGRGGADRAWPCPPVHLRPDGLESGPHRQFPHLHLRGRPASLARPPVRERSPT